LAEKAKEKVDVIDETSEKEEDKKDE